MSNGNWKELIKKYANGQAICNCGSAYYKNCGEGSVGFEYRNDLPICEYGCSFNELNARDYIADCIAKDSK